MEPTSDHKIVVVMGVTGSGKSSLVRLASGDESVGVGDSLKSATKDIQPYYFDIGGTPYCIVDTPGFCDTYESDEKVLELISEWLIKTYQKGVKISAMLYAHRISDTRVQGSVMNNFRTFRALCGNDFGSRICLCTTFWDIYEDDLDIAYGRMKELHQDGFWGEMCQVGSSIHRAPASQEELQSLISTFVKSKDIPLRVQHEIVDEGKDFSETSAMLSLLQTQLDLQREEHEKEREALRAKLGEEMKAREAKMREDFEKMQLKLEEQLKAQKEENEKTTAEMKRRLSEQTTKRPTMAKPPLPPRRAQTDLKSLFGEKSKIRQQKVQKYLQSVRSTINVLVAGRTNGHIKCDMNEILDRYMATCDNCLKTIGGNKSYECESCTKVSDAGIFLLCEDCHADDSVTCNDEHHDKADMTEKWLIEFPSRCPWVNNPPQNRRMVCMKCAGNIGICYLHCCNCNESWDMCVNCAIKGKHCPGHRRTFPRTAHVLQIGFRYMG